MVGRSVGRPSRSVAAIGPFAMNIGHDKYHLLPAHTHTRSNVHIHHILATRMYADEEYIVVRDDGLRCFLALHPGVPVTVKALFRFFP